MTAPTRRRCDDCRGLGRCFRCGGTGSVKTDRYFASFGGFEYADCPNGMRQPCESCESCNGNGYIQDDDEGPNASNGVRP